MRWVAEGLVSTGAQPDILGVYVAKMELIVETVTVDRGLGLAGQRLVKREFLNRRSIWRYEEAYEEFTAIHRFN
jgi:hypothetical protein